MNMRKRYAMCFDRIPMSMKDKSTATALRFLRWAITSLGGQPYSPAPLSDADKLRQSTPLDMISLALAIGRALAGDRQYAIVNLKNSMATGEVSTEVVLTVQKRDGKDAHTQKLEAQRNFVAQLECVRDQRDRAMDAKRHIKGVLKSVFQLASEGQCPLADDIKALFEENDIDSEFFE